LAGDCDLLHGKQSVALFSGRHVYNIYSSIFLCTYIYIYLYAYICIFLQVTATYYMVSNLWRSFLGAPYMYNMYMYNMYVYKHVHTHTYIYLMISLCLSLGVCDLLHGEQSVALFPGRSIKIRCTRNNGYSIRVYL